MYMAQERRQYILRLLEQRGSVRTTALARELGVTDETIRTDLVDMQAQGLLKRMHGGARYIIPSAPVLSDSPRLDIQLAHLVAAHIRPGMRIYADATPFTRVLVSQLSNTPCTFITPSPMMLAALSPAAIPHKIICTGGALDKTSALLIHPAPRDVLGILKPDLAILCPSALQPHCAGYKYAPQANWATVAANAAPHTLVVVPSLALTTRVEHEAELPAYSLITEDNIPAGFEDIPSETVPYISEASFNEFTY